MATAVTGQTASGAIVPAARRPADPPPAPPARVAPAAPIAAAAEMRRMAARSLAARVPLADALAARTPRQQAQAVATAAGLPLAELGLLPPDPRLIDRLGAHRCLALGLVPWRRIAGTTMVAAASPAQVQGAAGELDAAFAPWRPAIAQPDAILQAVAAARPQALAQRAETRAPERQSCRTWNLKRMQRGAMAAAALALAAAALAPAAALAVVLGWAVITLLSVLALRGTALWLALRNPAPPPLDPAPAGPLPVISVIVALYREADIAPRLLRRLGRIDYPRERLDIVLALEADDVETRAALDDGPLPPWIRVVVVPPGRVRTKPRALNYALDFCRGSIIGTWDAEDAPAPDQLRRVAARFAAAGPRVACLQGVLDYYNPDTNWLSRAFTIEYAAWFRVVMPGLQRMGVPLPLGGTTLFVRRAALEAAGAWDAHNVTEDADLGIRLARHGWRTEMIATVTEEEANCRLHPWLRQRSRWIKGHIVTWAVHMRDPRRLWRDLGPRGFVGYQVLFLGGQSQVLLAPLLLSLWALAAGLGHPAAAVAGPAATGALAALFLLAEGVTIATGIVGARRTRHRGLWQWAPTLHLYYPLAAVAGWRALGEIFVRPFYWAKTSHGHFDTGMPARQRVRTSPASIFSRVSKAREIWVRKAS